MKKFKAMKFWVGEDKLLRSNLEELLKMLGYKVSSDTYDESCEDVNGFSTSPNGEYWRCPFYSKEFFELFEKGITEEINIDWMRSPERATVKIGDKTYYEDELSEALIKIKSIEENN